MGLAEVGVKVERGRVEIDEHFATNVPRHLRHRRLWCAGRCWRRTRPRRKARRWPRCWPAGQPHIDYDIVPGVVYTHPEIASIGKTEEQLEAAGIAYKVGKFPVPRQQPGARGGRYGRLRQAAGRRRERPACSAAHIIGPDAGTLIAEIAIAMEFGASLRGYRAHLPTPHPTLEEAVKEAALAVTGKPIHI